MFSFLQAVEPKAPSPILDYELLKVAFNGNLKRFKRLASDHAKSEGIGVTEAIGKVKDKEFGGSLHVAAEGGNLEVCKYLIGTLKLDVNSIDGKGRRTPLHLACLGGHFNTVRYLLEKGADPDKLDGINGTPLHCAAKSGDTKIITLLLSRGVRIDVATSSGPASGTALWYAAFHGHHDAVKVLLDHGANPKGLNSPGRLTPLITAIHGKSWKCMRLLLEAGADPNAVSYGSTPLTDAVKDGCVDDIKCLLESGADPNHKENTGVTPLEIAAINCNYKIVEVLFPVTSQIPTYPDWSITGLMRDVNSAANKMQREVYAMEKFHQAKSKGRDAFQGEQYVTALHMFREADRACPNDAAVLSNMSACYARLDDGDGALVCATLCMRVRPEWPKAYYRMGVAKSILERYDDAADAFKKGLTLDPENKELKDAYMKAIEAKLNSLQV